jgi:chromosome segregation ATPase
VFQAQALADYHDDLRRTDIEKELRHEQHVTALEREVVMLRASLQVAETTIQRLLQEATAQQMALRTLQDEAARLKTDMESCCQRQSQHDDDLRRQTERNAALLTTIDALAQERDQWMTQQHTRDSQAAATRDERVKSVAEQVVRLQCVVEALQRTMGDLQAENALLRQDNGGLTALLRQAQEPGGAVKLPMRLGGPALAPPKGQRSGLRSKCRKCSKCDCGVR